MPAVWTTLEKLGASEEVVDHVRALEPAGAGAEDDGADLGDLWEGARRGDALVWLAARRGATMPDLVWTACTCAREAAGEHAERGPIGRAIEAAEQCLSGDGPADACLVAADACAELADAPDASTSYRERSPLRVRHAARSAEWAARGAEGLAAAAARYWARHEALARETGALLGIGPIAVMGMSRPRALRLVDPGQDDDEAEDELLYVVACAAESAAYAARALAAEDDSETAEQTAQAACAALVRGELTPESPA